MADEATLLADIVDDPGDPARRLVYADYLESLGDLRRAEVVRALTAFDAHTGDPKALLGAGRALLDLAEGCSRAWLSTFAHPTLARSTWGTRDQLTSVYLVHFAPDGVLINRGPISERLHGEWLQVGRMVVFDVNHFSLHEAVIVGDMLVGLASNPRGATWSVGLIRVAATALDAAELPTVPVWTRDGASSIQLRRRHYP